jgi:CRISPR/Cas system CSM-associated protein Csm3 (group 7 of RAMP superfamily)
MYKIFKATLIARAAVHIGSGMDSDLSDALIRRNARGEIIIPGTAIAGALRSLLTRLAPRLDGRECAALTDATISCDCAVCRLFGDVNPQDEAKSESAASRVLVFDAKLIALASPTTIRDGVGIDRASRASSRADAVKFDLEIIPAQSQFELRMELRADANEQLLVAGLAEWHAGRAWLGGRVGRGLGAFRLDAPKFIERELKTANQLVAFLKEDHPWENESAVEPRWLEERTDRARTCARENGAADAASPLVARCWLALEFTLAAQGPLLTNDSVASGTSGFDHAPLLAAVDAWGKPILTGAGLRGVLRSHAERIARTLATLNASNAQEFNVKCPACDPHSKRKNKNAASLALESCDSLLRFEQDKESDARVESGEMCLACRMFGSPRFGSRFLVEDAALIGEPKYKMLDFLAIDRFTGGGREGAKFDALALWQPEFRARLFFDNPVAWELGWLALVLRDLKEGWLSVGFGAAKGMGRVKMHDWTGRLGVIHRADFPRGKSETPDEIEQHIAALDDAAVDDGAYRAAIAQEANRAQWLALAQSWVAAFHDELLKERPCTTGLELKRDTYFDRVDSLYRKEVTL